MCSRGESSGPAANRGGAGLGISRTTLRTKLQALGLLSDRHARPAPREPHDPVADR